MAEESTAEEINEEKTIYEIGFHVVPTVDEGELSARVSLVKEAIKKEGGVLIMEESPKKISLAYSMSKMESGKRTMFDSAYFGWLKFEMDRDNIGNIKRVLDENNDILRFLIIKTVREDTRVPRRVVTAQKAEAAPKPKPTVKLTKKETPASVVDAEIDRTIEELIVE
ncbi:30S ribosomal protein S6 [Patescibacteria group bacterium]|nr:30S ribosomal protein S6 [Patescibacteria group bacterium]